MSVANLKKFFAKLDHLIDVGLHEDVTREEVEEHVAAGDVVDWAYLLSGDYSGIAVGIRNENRPIASGLKAMLREPPAYGPHLSLLFGSRKKRLVGWEKAMRRLNLYNRHYDPEDNGICILMACVSLLIEQEGSAWEAAG